MLSAGYDVWKLGREAANAGVAGIVMHFVAILVEGGLLASTVLKTMQMDLDASFAQRFDFIEKIKNATIIYRIWYIKRDNM